MKKLARCKACGYIMEDGVWDECPACGVPSKMFEPYEDKVPEARRKYLEMHLHPVIVHAPQAIAFLLMFMIGLYILGIHAGLGVPWLAGYLGPTITVLTILLPVVIIGSILTGLMDGKYRYKRLDTIMLKRKTLLGCAFGVLSIGMLVLSLLDGFGFSLGLQLVYLALNIGAFVCSVLLGWWGTALTVGAMPGPFLKKKPAAKAAPANANSAGASQSSPSTSETPKAE